MRQSLGQCRWANWPERRVGSAQLRRAAALGGRSNEPGSPSVESSETRVPATDAGVSAADAEVAVPRGR